MKQTNWYIHPVFVFVLSTMALAISLFLYIYWYVGISARLEEVIQSYHLDPSRFFEAKTWVVILVLSILVGVILVGILTIFIYNLKTLQLYQLQHSFINNFTHELKTPVTSLKIYLETFLKHELSREDQCRYTHFMLQDTERLAMNINSILNLARIESNVYDGEFTSVDIDETIRRFLSINDHIFRDCEIRLENRTGGTPMCPVIVPLFEMMLMNILTNAAKYNRSGRPRVTIVLDRDGSKLFVHFLDNGIGIAKGETMKIFRKFYQGSRRENGPVGGSGIGLYLVAQIARLHSGRIVAESEGEGKGSRFTLSLPCKTPAGEGERISS
ncbi:MAG: HAMP domain-containing histidine kinase [Deltaproteobacteria bacterium]|nr:HAMP domain-containing histidine kinase [Deltaproteobacteria bacterium]